MDSQEPIDLAPEATKPRAITVIGLFIAAAALISYLVTYAFTDALVKAEFFTQWQPGHDPRPKRFIIGFAGLCGLFSSLAGFMRLIGRNHQDRDEDEAGES